MLAVLAASPLNLARAAERRLSANAEYLVANFLLPDRSEIVAGLPPACEPVKALKRKTEAVQAASTKVDAMVRRGKSTAEPSQPPRKRKDTGATKSAKPETGKGRVKLEAVRDMPFRSNRHKAGFYSEQNLTSLAWKGEGTVSDPIQL